jgi:hypothetical protein
MAESDDEILTTEIEFWPVGVEEVELRTIVFGEDPLILIEPLEDRDGFALKLSQIDPALAGWALGLLAVQLEDEYGAPEPVDEDDA